jgi:hypothetical protein
MTGNLVTTVTSAGIQTSRARQLQPGVPEDMVKEHERECTSPKLFRLIIFIVIP